MNTKRIISKCLGKNAVESEMTGVGASEFQQVQEGMKSPTRQVVPVEDVIIESKRRKLSWMPRQMRGKV